MPAPTACRRAEAREGGGRGTSEVREAGKQIIRAEGTNEGNRNKRSGPTIRWSGKQKGSAGIIQSSLRRTAAAYSPTWWGSTIGDGGLNFSVRNGKRWYPAAIATAIYYLREIINAALMSAINASFVFTHTLSALQLHSRLQFPAQERFRAISTGRLRTLLPVHLLPINVVVSHDPIRKSHLEDGFALRCFQRLS